MHDVIQDEMEAAPSVAPAASVTADLVRAGRTPPSSLDDASFVTSGERAAFEFTPQPGDFLKHYEIIRKLGQGGMGVVLLARDTKLGRLVAIKLLQDHGQASLRLLAEARATALCKHENIVGIHDVDETNGHPYMVLEYLEGRTLREVIASNAANTNREISKGVAFDIVISVLRALAAAHERDVVHRDLKPENIMILDSGGLKVLDFGLARRGDALDANRGGTLAYMAPEQWIGGQIDARTDLWAVGVLLYELFAGAHPLDPVTRARLETVADLNVPMPKLGDVKPEYSAISEVVDRCLRKQKDERFTSAEELLAALSALRDGGKRFAFTEGALPFAGLAAFQEADADHFFGRERDIAALLGRLRLQRLITVVGPSGAGKSSFLRAGVIPTLKNSGEDWGALVLRPGRAPLSALRDALGDLDAGAENNANDLADLGDLRTEPGLLGVRLRAHCRLRGPGRKILVFVDQFEEIYTLVSDPAERLAFLQCLLGVADDASSPLRVIVTIRSDFLDRVAEDPPFLAKVTQGLFLLPPMGRDALREAMVRPVETAGHRFEDEAMMTEILDALAQTKTPLPLLQFSAVELWEARDQETKTLTRATYERLGGVFGSLSTHADSVFSALSLSNQRLCHAIFLRLITPERTRAIVNMAELGSLTDDPSEVEALVQHLCGARLLHLEVGNHPGQKAVELVHEALIERWSRLARWLDESTVDAQFLSRLRAAASQWQHGQEAPGLLWRDRAAEEALAWYARRQANSQAEHNMPLGHLEERYLLAVIDLHENGRRRRRRTIAGAFAILGTFSIVVLLLAMQARAQAQRADAEAARVNDRNTELAFQALRGRNATRMLAARGRKDDPTLVLAIVREVEARDIPKEWSEVVSEALASGVTRDEIVGVHGDRPVYAAAISPDGKQFVTASDDKTARISNVGDLRTIVTLRGHDAHLWSAAWSPDGKRVLTASADKTARIWNADGSREPLVLRGHESDVSAAEMSRDGRYVVTASDDKTARVFNAMDGTQVALFKHEATVTSARFSPNGERIVTAGAESHARVWNANGKDAPLMLRGHTDDVVAASWSPDGKRIVTGSKDATVRVWDARDGRELRTLRGHTEKVMSVAWSPDGKRIVSASKDKTSRIWDVDGVGQPIVLRGHKHWVYTADFSPDGRYLLTTSLDRSLRYWDLAEVVTPKLLEGHTDLVNAMAWSPDSARVVTASRDGTARIWRVNGEGSPVVLQSEAKNILGVKWSPDSMRIVTGSTDGVGRIWRIDDPASPVVLGGHKTPVWGVDWNAAGDQIVTASTDGAMRVWSSDGSLRAETKAPVKGGSAVQASFEPSGTRVVASYESGEIYVWDPAQAGEPVLLGREPQRPIPPSFTGAHWSPDGSRVLAPFADGTARIWDVRDPAKSIVLRGHEDVLAFAMWSPDGKRIVTTSLDRTARVWNADGSGQSVVLGGHGDRLTWASMSPDGARIATASVDTKVRVFHADGSGQPFVLGGSTLGAEFVHWSPDGKYIAQGAEENVARIWPAVKPFSGPEDARLWSATSYCIPVQIRRELLQVTEAEAQRDFAACEKRVAAARASERNLD